MMGVRFNRSMRPWGQGDIAWLPDDVAKRLIKDGDAEQYRLPRNPHAADPVRQPVAKEGASR